MEDWRPISGFEAAYEVSNLGRVRSLDRMVTTSRGDRPSAGRVLKLTAMPNGYLSLGLKISGKKYTRWVHRLVAEAFLGPCPDGKEVLHGNGVRSDNRLENLRYGTRAENVADTIKHGRHPWVGKTHCPNGHEYTPENTRMAIGNKGRPKRQCITCRRASDRSRRRAA